MWATDFCLPAFEMLLSFLSEASLREDILPIMARLKSWGSPRPTQSLLPYKSRLLHTWVPTHFRFKSVQPWVEGWKGPRTGSVVTHSGVKSMGSFPTHAWRGKVRTSANPSYTLLSNIHGKHDGTFRTCGTPPNLHQSPSWTSWGVSLRNQSPGRSIKVIYS